MDTELDELSKAVFERTGWHGIDHALANLMPVYTSDYLLEKLPSWTRLFKDYGEHPDAPEGSRDSHYRALYDTSDDRHFWLGADTLLKALLKLTIALHEAGELK